MIIVGSSEVGPAITRGGTDIERHTQAWPSVLLKRDSTMVFLLRMSGEKVKAGAFIPSLGRGLVTELLFSATNG